MRLRSILFAGALAGLAVCGPAAFQASSNDLGAGVNTPTMQSAAADDGLEATRLQAGATCAPPGALAEFASWAMMVVGVLGLGGMLRLQRKLSTAAA